MDNIQKEPRQRFIKRRSPIVFFIFAVIPSVIFELLYIYFGLYELLFASPVKFAYISCVELYPVYGDIPTITDP